MSLFLFLLSWDAFPNNKSSILNKCNAINNKSNQFKIGIYKDEKGGGGGSRRDNGCGRCRLNCTIEALETAERAAVEARAADASQIREGLWHPRGQAMACRQRIGIRHGSGAVFRWRRPTHGCFLHRTTSNRVRT